MNNTFLKITAGQIFMIIISLAVTIAIWIGVIAFIAQMLNLKSPDTLIAVICMIGFLIVCFWFFIIAKLLQSLDTVDAQSEVNNKLIGE